MAISSGLSKEDLRGLPRLARVAFAAKCGRRVQDLLRVFMPSLQDQVFQAFERALTLAEQVGAGMWVADGLAEAAEEARKHASGLMGMAPVRSPATPPAPVPAANIVAYEVGNAVTAAVRTAEAALRKDEEAAANAAFDAYEHADSAARSASSSGLGTVMQYDFQILRQATDRGQLNDDSAVLPEFAGFEKELETYRREFPKLLPQEGRFVAIRDQQLVGPLATYEDAVQAAYERFGLQPFLVKRIEDVETVHLLPSRLSAPCSS